MYPKSFLCVLFIKYTFLQKSNHYTKKNKIKVIIDNKYKNI